MMAVKTTRAYIEPFRADDAVECLRHGVIECGAQLNGEMAESVVSEIASGFEQVGMSLTIKDDQGPLVCVLVKPLWVGVIETLVLFSVRFKEHVLSGVRACKEVISMLFSEYGLHRIQATVRCDFPEGQRFAEWCGFVCEGIARKHSHDGMDAFYYGLTR